MRTDTSGGTRKRTGAMLVPRCGDRERGLREHPELDSHARLVYTPNMMVNRGALLLGLLGLLLSGAGEGLGGRR